MDIHSIIVKAAKSGIRLTQEQAEMVAAYWTMTNGTDYLYYMSENDFALLIESANERFIGEFRTPRDFGEWFAENSDYWKNVAEIVQVSVDYDSVFDYLYTGGDINYQDNFYFWGER